jgi:glycosyltransferase involved in cell wall biosynthesis
VARLSGKRALTSAQPLPTIDGIERPRSDGYVWLPSFMRILMIAPEPFFEPRGTPFSEYHRIRALLELGHTVDLVTYPFGQGVDLPGLRVFRCVRPPFLHRVGIGPSLPKVPLDLSLTLTAVRRVLAERYDVIHSHEEGAAIGIVLSAALRIPHVYDMHSSLPQQLSNFAYSRSTVLRWIFDHFERAAVRHSKVVIVICPELRRIVQEVQPGIEPALIENAPGAGDAAPGGTAVAVRATLGVMPSTPLVVYTGTFEAYQGLDLLFAAASLVIAARPDARFLLAGGRPEQVATARAQAAADGLDTSVIFMGERPSAEIPDILEAADVLVSPRSRGTNTPLKIYQYLRSGRAIVATRLLTHTQVLDDSVAILTGASPREFADGILAALADPQMAASIAARAAELAATKYSYDMYLERTREVMARLTSAARAQAAGVVA